MENATSKLNRGDKAPEFKLKNSQGGNFSFAKAVAEGSSQLLAFIHGNDCQACVKQLKEYQDNWEKFEDRGIRIVAISPKPVDYNLEMQKEHEFGFPVLADDGTVAEAYGIIEQGKFVPTLMLVDRHGDIDWIYTCQCGEGLDWPTMEYIFRHMVIARGV